MARHKEGRPSGRPDKPSARCWWSLHQGLPRAPGAADLLPDDPVDAMRRVVHDRAHLREVDAPLSVEHRLVDAGVDDLPNEALLAGPVLDGNHATLHGEGELLDDRRVDELGTREGEPRPLGLVDPAPGGDTEVVRLGEVRRVGGRNRERPARQDVVGRLVVADVDRHLCAGALAAPRDVLAFTVPSSP